MRILINAGYFNLLPCADNNIEISLAKEFIRQGNQCDIIGVTYDVEPAVVTVEGITVYKIPFTKRIVLDAMESMKQSFHTDGTVPIDKKSKIGYLLRHPVYSVVMKLNQIPSIGVRLVSNYADEAVKIFLKNRYDAVIGVVYSYERTEELFKRKEISVPKYYYQLDPFALYQWKVVTGQDEKAEREVAVMQECSRVFTTAPLMKQYAEDDRYAAVRDKLTVVEFPTFTGLDSEDDVDSPIAYAPHDINILFTGTVDDDNRNPVNVLSYFERVMNKCPNVKLFFLGNFESKEGKQFLEDHDLNVTLVKPVSGLQALSAMKHADMLLNIGNQITNMVPSKVFTYFQTGKPIINFQKINDCPARQYFDKYPLTVTIEETNPADQTDSLIQFINDNREKSVEYEDVKCLYPGCTPEAVVNTMMQYMK